LENIYDCDGDAGVSDIGGGGGGKILVLF